MKFDIGKIFENIVSLYARLSLSQKIALPVLMFGCMGTIVFVSRWANRPDYKVLYSNLEEGDAAAVVEKLKEQKIGYQLRDDGRTIEVTPGEMVHELRLEMASSGLPKGGTVGFELFNEPKLGMTAFLEKWNLVRALQGELERTIGSIEAVKTVRVHITAPERSQFVKRDVVPTASVLLRLKAGQELTPDQVKGISNLVAGSVERLTPENVTIMDSKGRLLSKKPDEEAVSGVDLTRLDYQRSLETALSRRIESMLAEVLGDGKAIARVSAEIDFNKFEKEEEAYDPGGTVMRSERSVEENGGKAQAGGVPGTSSNLTNDPGLLSPPQSSAGANGRRESVKNYEVSRAVSRTSSSAGKVARLSVAVLVDGQYVDIQDGAPTADGAAAAVRREYKPLTGEMLRKIENLVKQTVGFDSTRGDLVTVENIKFSEDSELMAEVMDAAEATDAKATYLIYGVPALLGLVFLLVVVRPLVRFVITPSEAEVDLSRLLPAGVEELEAELEAERAKLSAVTDLGPPSLNMEELEALLSENSRMVKDNPQQAALLIRYWLNDGRL